MGGSSTTTSKVKKPKFGIVLDSPVVASGDMLSGRVWADIPNVLKGTRMQVDFVGKEETKVEYMVSESYTDGSGNRQTRTRHEHAHSKRDIFRIALPVSEQLQFTHTGKIEPGQYVMPFSTALPAFLPSNMEINAKGGYAKISYKIKMALKGSGVFWDYTAEASVYVTSASIARYVPFDGPPDEQKVKSCCCFGRGSISVGASVDNTSLAKGQQAVISYACRNQSRNDVKDIYAELQEQQQQQPIYAAPAIPFAIDSSDVITTEPIICTSTFNYVYGGAAQTVSGNNDDEENYDIPIAAVATPIGGGQQQQPPPPSLALLLSKMQEAGIGDRDVVMNLYGTNNPMWDEFFAQLSPQDYSAIIGQISSSFDESDVAVYLASDKMAATFTCDHVAQAVRITEDWNRTNLIEKLIPYCTDFHLKPNRTRILTSLDDWNRCKAEVGFQEYLNSMADTAQPKKYIPHPRNTGTVMLNPAYADWMKANGN
ncbi:hypothetical protein FRACYDRAFT_245834 [Fragilariopsis cylindrus CCMP1102]|uniref:Arrestin-like N-terminal domain-containing protein n=1 Tax=Fragilariopsis cylindrus CCMP1102 TaxID=635003 RepID=A0A1E7EZE8_9STRA|nr:hypothetical protein FRACYDRAFT_245834 [Fragilariopsis cylindrus CCMP1102]|eukprot:OEU11380.1 hypothetical protein FRACYDRAFT_245834 [Fragilariopsis cylindrus CCMP1102]